MLKRIGTKPTVCTSWDTAKTTNFVVVFACWQNFMQIFEDYKCFMQIFEDDESYFNYNGLSLRWIRVKKANKPKKKIIFFRLFCKTQNVISN